jgi:translocation and assembly module TamB
MTKPRNNPEHLPQPNGNPRLGLLFLKRTGIALGAILLVGLVGGAWRLWTFVHKDLAPLVERNLTQSLKRPVKLGAVEKFSLSGVRFGASAIPPTPTDPDKVTVDGVEASFDPLQLLLARRLKLDVNLINPDLYLEQDSQGRWLTTTINVQPQPGAAVKTEVNNIRFSNGDVVLMPYRESGGVRGQGGQGETQQRSRVQGAGGTQQGSRVQGAGGETSPVPPDPQSPAPIPKAPFPNSVSFSQVNGVATPLENNQLIGYDLNGLPATGGTIKLQGSIRPRTGEILAQIQTQDLLASDVTRLVRLPLELQAGRVNGSVNVQLRPQQPTELLGNLNLQKVTAKVDRLPQAFSNSHGLVRFNGTEIKLENVSTNYGRIPLVTNGIIDTKNGFQLTGRVKSVNVADAQQTLNVKFPLPTTGDLQADIKLAGELQTPILTGKAATIKAARIDKVDFKSIRAGFEFVPERGLITIKDIQGEAAVGGQVTGEGRITLSNTPNVNFNLQAQNVPGDAIAAVYEAAPNFQIGKVQATANISGTPANVQTVVQYQAPGGTYPSNGKVVVNSDRTVLFRNVALSVAGGTVMASGSWANQKWQAVADASGVQVARLIADEGQRLLSREQGAGGKTSQAPSPLASSVNLEDAKFNGRLLLSGTTNPFQVATIRPQGARVQVGGGTVTVTNFQFNEQQFAAQLRADGVRPLRVFKTAPPALSGALSGNFQIAGPRENFSLQTLRGTGAGRLVVGGGTVSAANIQVGNGRFQAQFESNGVQVQQLTKVPPQLQGALTGKFNVAGPLENVTAQNVQATGQGRLNVAGGTLVASNIQLGQGQFRAQVNTNNMPLGRLAQVQPQFQQGRLTGQFNITGLAQGATAQNIQATGQARLNIADGTITANNIQVAQGQFQAQVNTNNVILGRLAPVQPQIQGGRLTGQFQVAGAIDNLQPQAIQARGQGRLSVADGTISASNLQLADGRFTAQVQANNVLLQRLAPVPPPFQGRLTGNFAVAGTANNIRPETIQATGEADVNVAGGSAKITNLQLADGNFTASVDASKLQLRQFGGQLQGELDGELQVAGNVDSFNLADLRGSGNVLLSQGVPGVNKPLRADVEWNGRQLIVNNATADGVDAQGAIAVRVPTTGAPEITALNLNVNAKDYNLQELPLKLPNALKLAGRADFGGKITGNLTQPGVQGDLTLRELVVNDQKFESPLAGTINSVPGTGLDLNVAGQQDKIILDLDGLNRPRSFTLQRGTAVAIGKTQGDNLAVNVSNFPLELLNISPPSNTLLGKGKVAGTLSGDIAVNRTTFAPRSGNVTITNPEVGRLRGQEFGADFTYNNDTISLRNGRFTQQRRDRRGNPIPGDTSTYAFTGEFTPTPKGPELKGEFSVDKGRVQEVLMALQIFDLQDLQRGMEPPTYADKSVLTTESVGLPDQPLLVQLRRLAEINALLEQQRTSRRQASPLPELADLNGNFSGTVRVEAAPGKELTAAFDFNGTDFTWGREDEPDRFYQAEQIVAQGQFQNGVLTLLPLRIQQSQNRQIAFTGTIGGEDQSGQLQVSNFPVDLLNNFVRLPVGIAGNLSGTATLAGSIKNPRAIGELQLTEGKLNNKDIKSAVGSFNYNDGRLNFGSLVEVVSNEPTAEPIRVTGSIPITSDNKQIVIDANLKNEGLGLLNLLTNQVTFVNGQGEVNLKVDGTLGQPRASGIATLNNATFTALALPDEPLTNVNGTVRFEGDLIVVDNLQGDFSKGQLLAQGEIPIANAETPLNNPLKVSTLEQRPLNLNIKALYRGGASGNLNITGTALAPIIGGNVQLANGQILLGEATGEQGAPSRELLSREQEAGGETSPQPPANSPSTSSLDTSNGIIRFNGLDLNLGNNVRITRQPIIDFRASGELRLDGSLSQPSPTGNITLRGGGINLFTTQFVLTRGDEHTATFTGTLDPELDISLVATVPEVVQSRLPNSPLSASEINDEVISELGALRTVRVQARIQGLASTLDQNLELTSTPSRSQTEIVALLGGGFVQTFGRGDTTLGLANLAGSALLGNFQGPITEFGNALGLSELRLFPTIISEDNRRGTSGSTFGLAVEAGIDLFRNDVSVSALRVLTADQPTQFGLNYRVNDNLRVRTSTDFFGDSRAIVEYERRF